MILEIGLLKKSNWANLNASPHPLKVSDCRSLFLAGLLEQLICQRLPSIPGIVTVTMIQQPFAGTAGNNQGLHLSALCHGVGNAPTFYIVDYCGRFGFEFTNSNRRSAWLRLDPPGLFRS
jgi:hypothetical protein